MPPSTTSRGKTSNVERRAHFRLPPERPFARAERGDVTILFGGLTHRHDRLIQAGLEGLGYSAERIPTPCKRDFQAGREYGNNGQCNPTYFTVGALLNRLKRLRDEQEAPADEILRRYAFATAGSCGPCRFGMYEAEYRLALRKAGFEGFRVLLFDQNAGLDQGGGEAGLEMNPDFFLALLNAVFMGDLLNEVAYHVRPYEVVPGRTDAVFERCLARCCDRLRERARERVRVGSLARVLSKLTPLDDAEQAAKLLHTLRSDCYTSVLEECAGLIQEEIEVDYTRPKPIAKITGEIWAQTTEGDGNFHMFSFLEREGAEVVSTWICYVLAQERSRRRDRRGLDEDEPGLRGLRRRLALGAQYRKQILGLRLAEILLGRAIERLRVALGGTAQRLASQLELQRLGHPYYNTRATGGEGHLEVAKNIYYANHHLAHMVLSLKPFGCMPSTQSDGAQAAVVARYPDMIFLPIETSGEGDVNAHSRVQMALGEAKARCKEELARAVARTGYALEEIRAYVSRHRELRRPLLRVPREPGVVGRAANFVLHVGRQMRANGVPWRGAGPPRPSPAPVPR
jgi:predicted nucleotide-binding protein (sugar kinase/HSP70/actin superfamily)